MKRKRKVWEMTRSRENNPSPSTIYNPLSTNFRRFTQADVDGLTHLMAVIEVADEGGSRAPDEIRAELEAKAADLARTGWLAHIDTGSIVGYNYVEGVGGPEEVNFWLRGAVHPDWRREGLGYELIQRSWADLAKLRAPLSNRPGFVNAWSYEHDARHCRLLARFGLRPYHIYHELEIPATQVQPVPPLPATIVIRPWDDSYCEAAVELRNRAFAQSWGYQPTTAEALRRRFKTARYEPTLSFTAWRVTVTSEAMIGLVHACLGWTRQLRQANEGEIVWVAVAQEARGQGIGRALMLTAMNALRVGGVETISVSADSEADQPAIGLYTRLGFAVRKAIVDYRKEL